MKKVLFILFVSYASFFAQSQNKQEQAFVDVSGQATYKLKPKQYTISFIITEAYSYGNKKCYKDVKDEIFKKLFSSGIDTSAIKQNELEYYTSGRSGDGKFHIYESQNKEKLITFLKVVNSPQVQIIKRTVSYKDNKKEEERVRKKAIEKAKKNATQIAKALNKKLGKIVSISEYNQKKDENDLYYNLISDLYYEVKVRFELH